MDDRRSGEIYDIFKYTKAKILNHTGWDGKIPRHGNWQDIDMVLDNDGTLLFAELSSKSSKYEDLCFAQRKLAYSLVKPLQTHVLLYHNNTNSPDIFYEGDKLDWFKKLENQIDTYKDIVGFSVMYWDQIKQEAKITGPWPGNNFYSFVIMWWEKKLNFQKEINE